MYLPMKRLIYLSMAVLMAALAVSCKKDSDKVSKSEGVLTTKETWDLALPLTWTSNKEYEKTEDLYVKGKIVEIKELGYYVNGGTYGNASYTIASNETPHYTVYCFRILYLGNQKNVSVRDIQLGDDVIICGKLVNYEGHLIVYISCLGIALKYIPGIPAEFIASSKQFLIGLSQCFPRAFGNLQP